MTITNPLSSSLAWLACLVGLVGLVGVFSCRSLRYGLQLTGLLGSDKHFSDLEHSVSFIFKNTLRGCPYSQCPGHSASSGSKEDSQARAKWLSSFVVTLCWMQGFREPRAVNGKSPYVTALHPKSLRE